MQGTKLKAIIYKKVSCTSITAITGKKSCCMYLPNEHSPNAEVLKL